MNNTPGAAANYVLSIGCPVIFDPIQWSLDPRLLQWEPLDPQPPIIAHRVKVTSDVVWGGPPAVKDPSARGKLSHQAPHPPAP